MMTCHKQGRDGEQIVGEFHVGRDTEWALHRMSASALYIPTVNHDLRPSFFEDELQ
jgi:hypothetical protein